MKSQKQTKAFQSEPGSSLFWNELQIIGEA